MKTTHLATLALAGALALPGVASAQTGPISSSILGYYTLNLAEGQNPICFGLVKKKEHQGAMDNLAGDGSSSTITENDRTFTPGEFTNHYVEILEPGVWEGLIVDITANDANTITVDQDLAALGLTGSEAFCIRQHTTLQDLIPNGEGLVEFNDSLTLFYPDGSSKTFLVGFGQWVDGNFQDASGEVVRPGQGALVFSSVPTSLLIGRNGVSHVKETPTMVELHGGAVNLVGIVNPLVSTGPTDPIVGEYPLSDTGLQDQLGQFQDSVTVFDPGPQLGEVGTFLVADFGFGAFFTSDGATDQGDTPVPFGASINVTVSSADLIYHRLPSLVPAAP